MVKDLVGEGVKPIEPKLSNVKEVLPISVSVDRITPDTLTAPNTVAIRSPTP